MTYYHRDHLSVRLTTDGSGNVLSQQGTLPYGEPWYQSGTGNKWMFTSYYRDSESGLDYVLARYYDSRTGTFCSADLLAGSPDDPQSWNRYPYGRNDPIDITDPSGKSWWSTLIDIGIGVGVALLPEFAPAWFGAATTTTTTVGFTSSTLLGVTSPGAYYVWSSSAFDAGLSGGIAGAQVAAANNSPTQSQPRKPHNPCNDTDAMAFTKTHASDAASVATQLHVPTENVLGLSGAESRWSAGRFATDGNNFFSLQGNSSSPFANGQMEAQKSTAVLSKFPSYLASARSFAAQYGNQVSGIQGGQAFAKVLTPRFNNLNAAKGGDPKFIDKTSGAISDTKKRMKCLGIGANVCLPPF